MTAEQKPDWVGIAMVYPDGRVVAMQIEGEDLVGVPSIKTIVDEQVAETADMFANPRSWTLGLGARLSFDTRRVQAWVVGAAYAKTRQRHELDPREITG